MSPIEKSRPTTTPDDHSRSQGSAPEPILPLQFVAEDGRRARSKSTSAFAIRSQAAKHAALKRYQKENPPSTRRGTKASNLTTYSWVQIAPRETRKSKAVSVRLLHKSATKVDPMSGSLPRQGKGVTRRKSSQVGKVELPCRVGGKQPTKTAALVRCSTDLTESAESSPEDELIVSVSPTIAAKRITSQCQRRLSLQNVLGPGRGDPFQSYPIKAEPWMHKLLDHCFMENQDVARGWQRKHGQRITGFSRLNTDFTPLCLTDEMSFISLLLISEFAHQVALGENPWSLLAVKLSTNCVERLRRKLDSGSENISNTLLITVVNLASSALIFNRDLASFNYHVNGIRRMVKLCGGLQDLHFIVKEEFKWLTFVQDELIRRARTMHSRDFLPTGQEGFLAMLSPEELDSLPYEEVLEVASENIPSTYFFPRSDVEADFESSTEIMLERRRQQVGTPQRSTKQKTWTWLS